MYSVITNMLHVPILYNIHVCIYLTFIVSSPLNMRQDLLLFEYDSCYKCTTEGLQKKKDFLILSYLLIFTEP